MNRIEEPSHHLPGLRNITKLVFSLFLLLSLSETAWVLIMVASAPSEAQSAVLGSFSAIRLGTIGFLGLILGGLISLLYICWFKSRTLRQLLNGISQKRRTVSLSLVIAFFTAWIFYFLPVILLIPLGGYIEKVRPVIWLVGLLVTQAILGLALLFRTPERPLVFKSSLGLFGVVITLFILIWVFIATSKVGIQPDDRFWNEAGVPLLPYQALSAWAICLGVGGLFEIRAQQPIQHKINVFYPGNKRDIAIAFLIWIAATLFWVTPSLPRSYFAPGPYLPNQVYYPFSDAQIHDTGAQFVFIGQGLNNSLYHDKPFYMLILTLLHILAGQEYSSVTSLQAAFFALFPVILYFLGKKIHSRTAGLLAAIFLIIQQANSIVSTTQIQVSNSRLMLTEFPTAAGISILCLILVDWVKKTQNRTLSAFISGGVLGVLLLIRTNPLFLVPFTVLVFLLALGRNWRKWIASTGGMLLGIALVISPWFLFNKTPQGRPFLVEKIRAVLVTRYDQTSPSDAATSIEPTRAVAQAATPSISTTPTLAVQASEVPAGYGILVKALQFIPSHFFHNLAMTFLELPSSIGEDARSLKTTLNNPFWKTDWNGAIPVEKAAVLAVGLIFLAGGITIGWNRAKLAGLVPLLMFIGYHFSNALGRTSGSRYLVPVDWVLWFYLALGLVQFAIWTAGLIGIESISTEEMVPLSIRSSSQPLSQWGFAILTFLILGMSVSFIGKIYPLRYPAQTNDQLAASELALGVLQKSGVSDQTLRQFLTYPGAVILKGRALYPRYYPQNAGEPFTENNRPFAVQNYPRLILYMIGPSPSWVILPFSSPIERFPDAADVTVIGCKNGTIINSLLVQIDSSEEKIYMRTPAADWKCPLPAPACSADGACQ